MDKWRIRQQRRRTEAGLLQFGTDAQPSKKTSNLEAVKNEYKRCRDEWKESTHSVHFHAKAADLSLVHFNSSSNEDSSVSTEYVRKQMLEIFQVHNPSKVGEVDILLQKYAGDEENLLNRIKKKYTTAPPIEYSDANLPGTRVFMEFTLNGVAIGKVRFRLYDSEVPLTTDNFKSLCSGEKVLNAYFMLIFFINALENVSRDIAQRQRRVYATRDALSIAL